MSGNAFFYFFAFILLLTLWIGYKIGRANPYQEELVEDKTLKRKWMVLGIQEYLRQELMSKSLKGNGKLYPDIDSMIQEARDALAEDFSVHDEKNKNRSNAQAA